MTIWTKEQKAEMLRLSDEENLPNEKIGELFNTSGSNIRKVLVRLRDKVKQQPELETVGANFHNQPPDRLQHGEFKPADPSFRPQPPKIMPKNFQKRYFNPD